MEVISVIYLTNVVVKKQKPVRLGICLKVFEEHCLNLSLLLP